MSADDPRADEPTPLQVAVEVGMAAEREMYRLRDGLMTIKKRALSDRTRTLFADDVARWVDDVLAGGDQ